MTTPPFPLLFLSKTKGFIPVTATIAAAGTLTGTTLAVNVLTSSLTAVGTLIFLAVTGAIRSASVGATGGVLYKLPLADGAPGQKLTTDGAGNLYWS